MNSHNDIVVMMTALSSWLLLLLLPWSSPSH